MSLSYLSTVFGAEDPMTGSYPLVGISSAVCGNLIISVALNVQRYAHLRLKEHERPQTSETSSLLDSATTTKVQKAGEAEAHLEKTETYLTSRWWWLGVLLMTVGETGNFVAYGFAPASVVSPLGVLALVSNCIVAPMFFNEKITRRNLMGVGITVLGILLIITSVQPSSTELPSSIVLLDIVLKKVADGLSELSPHEFIVLAISQLSFKIYLLVVMVLMAILFMEATLRRASTNAFNLFSNLGLVALFGAFTALSTKALSSIINFSFSKALVDPLTYSLLLVLALTSIVQVIYLNRALALFDATMVLPVHFVLFTISVIVGSAITFHDFENSDLWHISIFFLGCILTFNGVWLITSSSVSQPVQNSSEPLAITAPDQQSLLNYSSISSNNESQHFLALPSTRPPTRKSYSYANIFSSEASPQMTTNLKQSISLHPPSFSTDYNISEPSDMHVGSLPTFRYLSVPPQDDMNVTPSPTPLMPSGILIGMVVQAKRSMDFKRAHPSMTQTTAFSEDEHGGNANSPR